MLHFGDQSIAKHFLGSRIQEAVEDFACGVDADFETSITAERLGRGRWRKRILREQAHFESANGLLNVASMDANGRRRIQPAQKAVQYAGAAGFAGGEAVAQGGVALGELRQAVEEGAEVKSGTAGDYRQMAAGGDFANYVASPAGIFTRGVNLRGIENVEHMMGDAAAFH